MGRTGLKVTEVCLATMTFAGQCGEQGERVFHLSLVEGQQTAIGRDPPPVSARGAGTRSQAGRLGSRTSMWPQPAGRLPHPLR